MRINLGLLLYVLGFTAIIVLALQWKYELVRNIFFAWGIISSYSFALTMRKAKRVRKKNIPPYVD